MGFLDRGRGTLPPVTHHAAILVKRVRDYRMLAKRLAADIGEAGFFQTGVATGAAVYDSQLRKPYLLDAIVIVKTALERDRVSTAPN
jgi:hypothetical protein